MPIEFTPSQAIFRDGVSVDDTEALLQWLQNQPSGGIDLAACSHLHPACLQVLMAAGAEVDAWPTHAALDAWLRSALHPSAKEIS